LNKNQEIKPDSPRGLYSLGHFFAIDGHTTCAWQLRCDGHPSRYAKIAEGRLGKQEQSNLSRSWAEAHQIWGECRGPITL